MTASQPTTHHTSSGQVDAGSADILLYETDSAKSADRNIAADAETDAPASASPSRPFPLNLALVNKVASRRRWMDPAAALVYVVGALGVTGHGWVDPQGRLLGSRPDDQNFNEWMLSYGAHAATHLENPFFTTLQNAPDGVNLISNVGMQLIGFLLTPLTLLGGAAFSYLFLITINLAATGFAWYWLLSRRIVKSPVAAFIGGLFCAFAPALVSQSNGHPHITAQWLVPFIVWRVVQLTTSGRQVRDGLILAGLVATQFFIGLEILFLTAIGLGIAAIAYLVFNPRAALRSARTLLPGFGIAGAAVSLVAAYPLWMQFFGPQHRIGHPGDPDVYALTLGSFFSYATQSIAGGPTSAYGLTPNSTEESTFFGWPVLILLVVITLWARRDLAVRVLASTGVFAGLLAVGTTLSWDRITRVGPPGPFALIKGLPIIDSVVVGRFALITTVAFGLLFAIAVDRTIALVPRAERAGVPLRLIAGGALVAALLPILPMPLPVQHRASVPAFITAGGWRDHVAEGHTLVPVPVDNMRSVRWSVAGRLGFAVPQGYFLGPVSATDRTGRWGVKPRPTALLLTAVAAGERDPNTLTSADRAHAVTDVRHWKADALVLATHPREAELRTALDALFGPGQRVDDVWLWDVRPLAGQPS